MVSPTDNAEELDTELDQQNEEDSSTSDTSDFENAEDSSNSEASEDEQSTFDVVMDAIKPDSEDEDEAEGSSEDDGSEDSDEASGDGSDENEDSDDDFEDFTPEERAKLKKATTERFDKLKNLYHESKKQVTDLTTQLEQANVDAGNYKKFVDFLDTNRIEESEANQLFHIGALMKNDPVAALQAITPYYQELLHITGNVLPPDLQQQVNQGYITKDRALELSRLKAQGRTNQAIEHDKTQHQNQQEVNRQQEVFASVQGAIGDWEQNWKASDPDYNIKKDRVLERVELMLARAAREQKLPQTVEAAIELADKAKADVEKELSKFQRKKAVKPVSGGSSSSSMPEPKDTRDVILRTLNQ